jgi:hypothetical protein
MIVVVDDDDDDEEEDDDDSPDEEKEKLEEERRKRKEQEEEQEERLEKDSALIRLALEEAKDSLEWWLVIGPFLEQKYVNCTKEELVAKTNEIREQMERENSDEYRLLLESTDNFKCWVNTIE